MIVINFLLWQKYFIYKTYLTAQVCFQCRTILPNPMCSCEPQLLLWFWFFHRDPLKGKWWMSSCQASVPQWPWIHPIICYTANCDNDEHQAGSWRHSYPLLKKYRKRIKPASLHPDLQNFQGLLEEIPGYIFEEEVEEIVNSLDNFKGEKLTLCKFLSYENQKKEI